MRACCGKDSLNQAPSAQLQTEAPQLPSSCREVAQGVFSKSNFSSELSDTTSSLLVSPPVTAELKRLLTDLRHECAAATVRQEELFKQVLINHRDLHEELLVIRSSTETQANAQENLLNEFHRIATADAKTNPKPGSAGQHVTFEMTADAVGKEANKRVSKQNSRNGVGRSGSNLLTIDTIPSQTSSKPSSKNTANRKTNLAFETYESEGPGDHTFMERVSKMLRSKEFEFIVAFALVCNCFVMCWEAQYTGLDVGYKLQYPGRAKQADVVWTGADVVFVVFDWTFGMLFLLECIAKLICWQLKYFTEFWNYLDVICVIAFLFGKVFGAGFKPHMLRLLRLFRLARLVRLIRFLESLEALYVMTTAIAGMRNVLGWAMFLLTIMLLTCDLFLVQVLQATYFSEVAAGELTEDQLQKHHKVYEYFGTCTRCMLSMFEITLGNWPPIARLLSEEVSEWFTLLCVIHKLTIGFAVVGVITGVILQETFKVAQTDDIIMLRQKRRASDVLGEKLSMLYDNLDTNGDEQVDVEEFKKICANANIKTWLASLDIETDDLTMLFNLIDVDRDGTITMDELLTRMPRIRGTARSIDVLALQEKLKPIMQKKKDSS